MQDVVFPHLRGKYYTYTATVYMHIYKYMYLCYVHKVLKGQWVSILISIQDPTDSLIGWRHHSSVAKPGASDTIVFLLGIRFSGIFECIFHGDTFK